MKPIKFKHQNITFAENQPEYGSLPALKLDTPEGHVITCWKLSFKERLRILFFGRDLRLWNSIGYPNIADKVRTGAHLLQQIRKEVREQKKANI